MNKKEYLKKLESELKANNVGEIDDILSDYEHHFAFKLNEGYTEEEIALKLSSPKDIAKEYLDVGGEINKYEKGLKRLEIIGLSIPASMVYIIMWGVVIVLGTLSLASLTVGFCLLTTIKIGNIIPQMPYLSAFILGLSCFGLSLLSCAGTIYTFIYVKQIGIMYYGWGKNIINGTHLLINKYPRISRKFEYRLRLLLMISLICFVGLLILGYFAACLQSRSMEPWHIWRWFH